MNFDIPEYKNLKPVFLMKIDFPCSDHSGWIAVESEADFDKFRKTYESRVVDTKIVRMVVNPDLGDLFLIEVLEFCNEYKTSPYRMDNPFMKPPILDEIFVNENAVYGRVIVKCTDSSATMLDLQTKWYKKITKAIEEKKK